MLGQWCSLAFAAHSGAPSYHGRRVLDYGCGGGRFTAHLAELGFNASGLDTSKEMITQARKQFGDRAVFAVGNAAATSGQTFDVITSIMTLQFIQKIETTLAQLCQSLKPGGLLVFAVHNPAYAREWALSGQPPYDSFDPALNTVVIRLSQAAIPVYLRSELQYRTLLRKFQLMQVLVRRPIFTASFNAAFPAKRPTRKSEYLIMGFVKSARIEE